MFRILTDYLYSLLGLAASIVTLSIFMNNIQPGLSADGKLAVLFISGLFVWFFLENIYIKCKWGRERKYGQTLNLIADGFSEIHKLVRDGNNEIESTVRACEKLCNKIAITFTLITSTKCNASLKVLTKDVDDRGNTVLKAVTFARSEDSSRNPKNNKVKHWLDKNTDFLTIFDNIDRPNGAHFFANMLPFRFCYNNTSFNVYGKAPDNNLFLRYWRWPLPYKSTIVVPICPSAEQDSANLVGFLCVDSTKIGAFKRNHDVTLMCGIADGLYNVLKNVSV